MSAGKVDVLAVMESLCELAFENMPTHDGGQSHDPVLWTYGCAARAAVAELIEASRELLEYRVGNYPMDGWLRDNDGSRAQIDALATALARVQP